MKCRKCWFVVAVLSIAIAAMVYKFIFAGSAHTSPDGRMAVELAPGERDLILSEMRMFVKSIQKITIGISKNDMNLVEEASHEVGSAARQTVPPTLAAKLPLSFKTLGFETHAKFDQLALDARHSGGREQALKDLGELMNNCVACHASYRLEVAHKP